MNNLYLIGKNKTKAIKWLRKKLLPRAIFTLMSFPAFLYLQASFKIMPWKALALFDIAHRIILPYKEYAMALGPVFPLGLLGAILVFIKGEKKLFGAVSWVMSIWFLFEIFKNVPQQSPSRFTQALIHVPLGILTTYLFWSIWQFFTHKFKRFAPFIKVGTVLTVSFIILQGIAVMVSIVTFLSDQATAKRMGTYIVPKGAQLIYPLKDFMQGIYFLRDNTDSKKVVLAYEAAGNYIPSYAGNFVYMGHANTPFESSKQKKATIFFSGEPSSSEALDFLRKERISYVYFGPQEKEFIKIDDLSQAYPFLKQIYGNNMVRIYEVGGYSL